MNSQLVTKIYDVLLPENEIDFENFYLFLVLEYMPNDLRAIFHSIPKLKFSETHMISILYNMLCAINFVHSANVMHRDIKPSNFLINIDCSIKICDFGLSRSLPCPETKRLDRFSRAETG